MRFYTYVIIHHIVFVALLFYITIMTIIFFLHCFDENCACQYKSATKGWQNPFLGQLFLKKKSYKRCASSEKSFIASFHFGINCFQVLRKSHKNRHKFGNTMKIWSYKWMWIAAQMTWWEMFEFRLPLSWQTLSMHAFLQKQLRYLACDCPKNSCV